MGDAHIFECDVELSGALEELGSDTVADCLTLGDELGGIELGDDGFKNFVSDRWEDTLIVVLAEILNWRRRQHSSNV